MTCGQPGCGFDHFHNTTPTKENTMPVHNHGTEEGKGLSCQETRQPDGTLRGECIDDFPCCTTKAPEQAIETIAAQSWDAIIDGASPWSELDDETKRIHTETVQAVIDAAAGHISAEAYEKGHEAGYWDGKTTDMTPAERARAMNPYRAMED